jgi:hypothetical protein
VRLEDAFLLVWSHRYDDLVRRKRRKRVSNGEIDIRFPGGSTDCLARKLVGRTFGDSARMTDRFLVVREPVKRALTHDRHHNLDGFGVPDLRPQSTVRMFDGADDEDLLPHEGDATGP